MSKGDNFILGLLLGAAAALFLTPRTGKENREWLIQKLDENKDLIDASKHTTEELIHKTRQAIDDNIKHLNELVDHSKKKVDQYVHPKSSRQKKSDVIVDEKDNASLN